MNAVGSDKDFYVNGDGQINVNMNVFSLDSSSYIQCDSVIVCDHVKTNIIDSNGASDLTLKRNTFDICYFKKNSLELNSGINLVAPAQVQSNTYNSFDDSSVLYLRDGEEFMKFRKTEDDILFSKEGNSSDYSLLLILLVFLPARNHSNSSKQNPSMQRLMLLLLLLI